jgi:hypothetical protein
MRIDIQHGDAPLELVANDIFGLTKLNYNACRLGESQPVTIKFSDAVGEILMTNPAGTEHRPNFKFSIYFERSLDATVSVKTKPPLHSLPCGRIS